MVHYAAVLTASCLWHS